MKKIGKNIYALMTVIALIIGGINMPDVAKTGAKDIVIGTEDLRVCYQAENPVILQECYVVDDGSSAETTINVYERWPEGSLMDSVSWEAQGAVQTDYIPAERPLGVIEAGGLSYDTYVVSAFALPGREDYGISFSGNEDEAGDYFVLIAVADVGEMSVEVIQRRPFTYTVEDAEEILSRVTPVTSRTLTTEARRKAGVPIECDGRSVIIKGDFPEYPYTMISDTDLQVTGEDPAYDVSYFIADFEGGEDFDLYADGKITDRWETTYDGRTVTVLEEEYEGTSTLDVFAQLDDTYYLVIRQNAGEVTDFSEEDVRALLSHVEF